ncbi:hypothetical protein ACFQY7_50325 [Actinomadura luteofluorescens]|uniref:Uncharacterized protein n=1 Tax=Actinomadura luteofluorescens TaxID=46163 RepID=A0A7Y9JF43_9ACTN|nr:hypothetical protein [Actinomadura luteofluorescens]NYD46600.1 hypothetical protein [Actinomadura luteofluorescens]
MAKTFNFNPPDLGDDEERSQPRQGTRAPETEQQVAERQQRAFEQQTTMPDQG